MKPEIRIEGVSFGEAADPTFGYGTTHTAHATMTNPTPKAFSYNGELYLDETKKATSGLMPFSLAAGQTKTVDFPITMPAAEGTWHVLLDIKVGVELIAAYQATEDVTVVIVPGIDIEPITWD